MQAIVLCLIAAVPTLLSSCYFGGQLPVSPYKRQEELLMSPAEFALVPVSAVVHR